MGPLIFIVYASTLVIDLFLVCEVLSDQSKRALYDAGLYDPDEEEVEVSQCERISFHFLM